MYNHKNSITALNIKNIDIININFKINIYYLVYQYKNII